MSSTMPHKYPKRDCDRWPDLYTPNDYGYQLPTGSGQTNSHGPERGGTNNLSAGATYSPNNGGQGKHFSRNRW